MKGIEGFVEASKLVAEVLHSFLEICYFFRSMDVDNRKLVRKREAWCQQTHLSSFAVYEGLHVVMRWSRSGYPFAD